MPSSLSKFSTPKSHRREGVLSPVEPRSGLRNLGYPTSTARRPGALNFGPVLEDPCHGAAVARRGAGALSAMPRCYASIPCGSEAILPHDVARGYFRRGGEGVEVPGSAYPQRAGPPGRSVTSATISVRNSAFLWAPPHSGARPCCGLATVWLNGRAEPWRAHGGSAV